ncbi:hypothetical protein TrCOL_g7264 [Triparma columacea]|uniref:Uncharacterized protein n=1 Tax=Triparma columacea TaxID=722753 RepID=A0A9W7G321_9STRA|nr:hypothetical protein TrCOL_g7264 [Triparma columacea]
MGMWGAAAEALFRTNSGKVKKYNQRWGVWVRFCKEIGVKENLEGVKRSMAAGVQFAVYVRTNKKGDHGRPIKASGIREYLGDLSNIFSYLGQPPPFSPGNCFTDRYYPAINDMLALMAKDDSPVVHKTPMNKDVLLKVIEMGGRYEDAKNLKAKVEVQRAAIVELACATGLRGGEVVNGEGDKWRREKRDTRLQLRNLNLLDENEDYLVKEGLLLGRPTLSAGSPEASGDFDTYKFLEQRACYVELVFDFQKNGNDGQEVVFPMNEKYFEEDGLKVCAVKAAVRIVSLMIVGGATPDTLIAITCHKDEADRVCMKKIAATSYVKAMKDAGVKMGEKCIQQPSLLSAHSPRITFVMIQIEEGRNWAYIKQQGRWKSEAIYSYVVGRRLGFVKPINGTFGALTLKKNAPSPSKPISGKRKARDISKNTDSEEVITDMTQAVEAEEEATDAEEGEKFEVESFEGWRIRSDGTVRILVNFMNYKNPEWTDALILQQDMAHYLAVYLRENLPTVEPASWKKPQNDAYLDLLNWIEEIEGEMEEIEKEYD